MFMLENPSLSEIFDLKELGKLFRHFSVVTGLDVALFDFAGREILTNRKEVSVCQSAKNCRKCREHISYGGLMSQELGEPYICSCGCGLIMCFSPVMFEERLCGIIACGPVLLWDADEVAIAEFTEKIMDMNIHIDVGEFFRLITSCTCVNMTSAAQILFIMANSFSREHSVYLNQRAKITMQQQRIAELMMDRKSMQGSKNSEKAYPRELEKELIDAVQCGSREMAKRILNMFLCEIFTFADGNMNTIKARIFELVAFISRAAIGAGAPAESINGTIKKSFGLFNDAIDFEELCCLITEVMESFITSVFIEKKQKQYSGHLIKAMDYIGQHYADEITLHTVAEAVFVSEFYLSHLFRKEMNTTFSEYVCRVRINRAKAILKRDSDIRIQEIGGTVGFNDPNYFAKSFKKLMGISPREYQASFVEDTP
ncbi:PocR ligand-binding domain-containing protein [Treponema sp. TIM-1]|uniref:PocR ligand-binding domain-containing protein n=1 Tax=Treponema sp. TIM-1 TaxID=2898417 RepID=UPI00398066A3